MQKDGKQKISKELLWIFIFGYKKVSPKNFEPPREQNLLESLKKLAKMKEYKLTLQRVRLRLPSLNVQYEPWNMYYTVKGEILDASIITNCLNSSQFWNLGKLVRYTG